MTTTHDRWVQRVDARDTCDRITATIEQLCTAYQLSELEVARQSGLAIGSVKSLLERRRFPTIADLDAFARVFGVPGSDILRAAEVTR